MSFEQPFSRRNRYRGSDGAIISREDAPRDLRYFVLSRVEEAGISSYSFRDIVCGTLRVHSERDLLEQDEDVWKESRRLVYGCDWFRVYDIVEAIYAKLGGRDARRFGKLLNEFFIEEGIGWQLVNGQIVSRGTEAFESVIRVATAALEASERPTAMKHLQEALQDLSRSQRQTRQVLCITRWAR